MSGFFMKKTVLIMLCIMPLFTIAVDEAIVLKTPREPIAAAIPPCQGCCNLCGAAACLCVINRELKCIACEIAALSSELETLFESIIEEIDSTSDLILSSLAACCSLLDNEIASVSDVLGSKIDSCCSLLDQEIASVGDLIVSDINACCSFLDSVLDSVSDVIIAKLDCGFGISFGQADIPFTIINPGTYILCEDVEALAPSPSMITVANDDIIVNLNGHRVDGNSISGASGLINVSGVTNVVVKSGVLADSAGSDVIVTDAANIQLTGLTMMSTDLTAPHIVINGTEQVTMQALEIETGIEPAITILNMAQNTLLTDSFITGDLAVPALVTTNNTNGTIFENVWLSGISTGGTTGIQSSNDTNISIRNCMAELLETGYQLISSTDFECNASMARSIVPGGLGGFIIMGPSGLNGLLRECTVVGANSVGYSVSAGVANVVLRDCFAINANGGFSCDTVQNITWDQCIVEKSTAFGFSAATGQQLLFNECRAHKCVGTGFSGTNLLASDFIRCNAQAVGGGVVFNTCTVITLSGCQIAQSTTTGIQLSSSPNCVIEDTIVNGTTTLGYFFSNNSNGVTVENCRALNTAIGFSTNGSDSVVFKNCMADETSIGAGFSVMNAAEVVHDQSIALNCIGNGFEGISAQNMLYTNCSASSATNGFFASATDRLLYCECAAQSNQVGQFIAADCTHTVIRECCIGNNFVEDIENLALDTSIICIDDLFCAIGPIIALHQDNFSGPVTLNTPQHYKLCENVTASTTITITSSDLILDLGEFFLDGVSIIVAPNLNNVTIRNGQIRDVPFFIDVGINIQNLVIENLVLDGITASATQFGIRIASGPANGVTLRNLTFYNGAPTAILLNGQEVTNVILENINHLSSNQALTAIFGTDATINLFDCSQVLLKNILIADPHAGIDAILIVQSSSITLDTVQITTAQALSNTPAGVRLAGCNDVAIGDSEVTGEGFAYGFSILNPVVQSTSIEYTDCAVIGVSNVGFRLSGALDAFGNTNVTLADCFAIGTITGPGMMVGLSNNVFISDSYSNSNFGDGITTNTVTNCIIQNVSVTSNCGHGIDAINTNQLKVSDSICMQNAMAGFFGNMIDNFFVTECVSEKNGQEGFHVQGVNGGSIPGDPANTVGQSVSIMKTCFSFDNGGDGFYLTDVGGVRIRDCVSNYNFQFGMHIDNGSWNIFVEACTALSNGKTGFITWDTASLVASTYNNRFYFCYGSQNDNRNVYSPFLGLSDYAVNNAPGVAMTVPIGIPLASSQLMLPDPLALVPRVFCGYF